MKNEAFRPHASSHANDGESGIQDDENAVLEVGWLDSSPSIAAKAFVTFDEEKVRAIRKTVPTVVWIANSQGVITYLEPEKLALLVNPGANIAPSPDGYPQLELHPDDHGLWFQFWQRALQEKVPMSVEVRHRLPDGRYRWFVSRAVPLLDASGHTVSWFGTTIDIHDQKMVQLKVCESERRKDQFLALLGHEIRNPLSPIRTSLDLLFNDGCEHQDLLGLMHEQMEHLERLADDISDVSHLIWSRMELRKEHAELGAICERAVAAISSRVEKKGQEIRLDLPASEIWLDADPVRLVQIIENLLNNASAYSDRGKAIELRVTVSENTACLCVSDQGIGIAPDVLPRVFDLFVRGADSQNRSRRGLGIGLALVRSLTELHGGRISVTSAGLGLGSQFTVYLPISEARKIVREPEPEKSMSTEKHRILIVDDNADVAMMLGKLLSKAHGHEVATAHDGFEALEKVRDFRPRIILLDIELPGMSGYEVMEALKQSDQRDHVLIAALTGHAQHEERQRTAAAGFDEHLVKPLSGRDIQKLMAHPKLAQTVSEPSGDGAASISDSAAESSDKEEDGSGQQPGERGTVRDILHELGNLSVGIQLAVQMLDTQMGDPEHVKKMLLDTVASLKIVSNQCRKLEQ